jgi:hypothetical protein
MLTRYFGEFGQIFTLIGGGGGHSAYSACVVLPGNIHLMVHKNENFFGSDFEYCAISLLVMLKY